MIARIRWGAAFSADADAYAAYILRRGLGDETELVMVTLSDSPAAGGDDDEQAEVVIATVPDRSRGGHRWQLPGTIMRWWNGWTSPAAADAYLALLGEQVLPGIGARGMAGYNGAYVLRREFAEEVHFVTLLLFDSLAAVREFAGDDYERAYVPDAARAVLARFDERSAHYEVLGISPRTAPGASPGTR